MGIGIVLLPLSYRDCFFCSFLGILSPSWGNFLINMCWSFSTQLKIWKRPSINTVFFLCAALSSLVLCPEKSSCLFFATLSSQLRETTGLCLGSPSLCCGLKIVSRQQAGAIVGLSSFVPPCTDYWCVVSVAQYIWKPLFCPVFVSVGRVSLPTETKMKQNIIIPFRLEAESDYILNLHCPI